MNRQHLFGALAALCVALVGLNAYTEKNDYNVMRHWFDGEYKYYADLLYGGATIGAAVFGYLATQRKEPREP